MSKAEKLIDNSGKIIVGGFVAIWAIVAMKGCSDNRRERQMAEWENAEGSQGFINLHAVRDAFRKNESLVDFETRVNEIFEGDNLIVFQSKEISHGFELKGYEDLDKNKHESSGDDLLFTLSVKGRTAKLKGAGVNKYYEESWVYELPAGAEGRIQEVHYHSGVSPLFWWWMLSPGWGSYYTPAAHYDSIYSHRSTYRNSAAYRSQVSRNSSFSSQMNSKYGSSFRNSMSSTSSTRQSYIRTKKSSPAFRDKVIASSKSKTGAAPRSQMRSSMTSRSSSFSGSSSSSRSSGSYGSFRGSSGFGI